MQQPQHGPQPTDSHTVKVDDGAAQTAVAQSDDAVPPSTAEQAHGDQVLPAQTQLSTEGAQASGEEGDEGAQLALALHPSGDQGDLLEAWLDCYQGL